MDLSFLTGTGSSSSVTLFEIRLDDSNLILRGNENEAPGVPIRGSVVLCLSKPFRVSDLRLRLTGESKIGYPLDPPTQTVVRSMKYIHEQNEFLRRIWTFVSSTRTRSETLQPGNYEYPFEHVFPGNSPESVEGLHGAHVIYRLKATIDRGVLAADMHARKNVRLIRTFDMGSPDVAHEMTVEGVWPDKLDYTISTPSRGVVYGTDVRVDLVLIPLLKGLRIGKIFIDLLEEDILMAPNTKYAKKEHRTVRKLVKDDTEVSEDSMVEIEGRGQGFRVTRLLPIPKKLSRCRQSADTEGIQINHRVHFAIRLLNPDGHTSELRCNIPLHVFISPSLPLNDENELVNQGPQTTQSDELGLEAPPAYGDHRLDRLTSDIDYSGSGTPAGTGGFNTPFTSRSRSQSANNLSAMDSSVGGEVSASQLQASLDTVQNQNSLQPERGQLVPRRNISRPNSPGRHDRGPTEEDDNDETGDPGPSRAQDTLDLQRHNLEVTTGQRVPGPRGARHASRGSSASRLSTRGNHQSFQIPAPEHIETVDVGLLNQVPSYSTALHTSARTPISEHPPTYQGATIPISTTPLLPQTEPSTAHSRNRSGR